MHDLSQEAWRRKRGLQDRLADLFGSYGYRCLDTPILEPTELFLRKAGGELASRMYSFTDAGSNSVSLRPEFTSPIMRHYLEHAAEIDLPARWQYAGPVFRYEEGGQGNGQFTQVGAELVGPSSVLADAELLGLAAQVPSHLGWPGCRVEVTDLDVVHSVLDAVGVSERAKAFIISSVSLLKEGRQAVPPILERTGELHLSSQYGAGDYLSQAIEGLDDHQSRKVLQGLLQWSAADQLGQREPGEIVDRLLRKLRGGDDANTLRRALELASDLAGVRGEPEACLKSAREVIREAGAATYAIDRFEELLGLVHAGPGAVQGLVVDLGLVRGFAYYNGLVFEVSHPDCSGSLGGGGRYDGLATALGSPQTVPALGFAYHLEGLSDLTDKGEANGDRLPAPASTLILAEGPESYGKALAAALELRQLGSAAELDVSGEGLVRGLAYARKKGMTQVIVVQKDGKQTSHTVGPIKR